MDPYGLDLLATMIDAGTHETIAQIAESIRNRTRPKKILRMAKAECEAIHLKLETLGGFSRDQAQAILRPILIRNLYDANYSGVIAKAFPLIEPTAAIEKVSKDWLLLHYEKASKYSDEQIQYLWAKILAGELNNPGSFSTRTLAIVEQLTKETAETFNNLASFEFCIDGENSRIIIFDSTSEIYTKRGVTHETLNELDSCGLISYRTGPIWGGSLAQYSDTPEHFVKYGEKTIPLKYKKDNESKYYIILGVVALTKSGSELFRICESEYIDEVFTYTIENWEKK